MKLYEVIVDGYKVGAVELTFDEVRVLQSDADIQIKEVVNNDKSRL